MIQVKEITDYTIWDKLVAESAQGSIFSTTHWMSLFDKPFRLWGCYKGDELIGGIGGFNEPTPLTPFQGIIVKETDGMNYGSIISRQTVVGLALLDYCPNEFCNHWEFLDIRPFKWQGWIPDVKYTYVVYLDDMKRAWLNLDKDTRNVINVAGDKFTANNSHYTFSELYKQTFQRKKLPIPVSDDLLRKVMDLPHTLVINDEHAGVVMIRDNRRAYYILGASDNENDNSAPLLWRALTLQAKAGVKEVDLVGCNSQQIGNYKKGFGGELMPYYGVKRV